MTGASGDGATLADAALSPGTSGVPVLAIDSLRTQIESSIARFSG